eukprot:PhM_4_TR302/c0_g1_i1/m.13722
MSSTLPRLRQLPQREHELLHDHPTVQDLTVASGAINMDKVRFHTACINAGRGFLAQPALSGAPAQPLRSDPKVVRPYDKYGNIQWKRPPKVPSRSSRSNVSKSVKASSSVGGTPLPIPPALSSSSRGGRDDTCSVYSCNCSAAGSHTTFTCSCCGSARTPSLLLDDNMTSVSQRCLSSSGRSSASSRRTSRSMHSQQLAQLEQTIEAERQQRLRTENVLDDIRRRQKELMDRLTAEERKALETQMGATNLMS